MWLNQLRELEFRVTLMKLQNYYDCKSQFSHTNLCHGNDLCHPCSCRQMTSLCSSFSKAANADCLRTWVDNDTALVAFGANDALWMTYWALDLHWSRNIKALYTSRTYSMCKFIFPKWQRSNDSCRAWGFESKEEEKRQEMTHILQRTCFPWTKQHWLTANHHLYMCPRVLAGRLHHRVSRLSPSWQTAMELALGLEGSCPPVMTWTAETLWRSGRCLQPSCLHHQRHTFVVLVHVTVQNTVLPI